MKKILPGYFIPIWKEIMYKRRDYSLKIISSLTLIPIDVLKKYSFFYESKEDYLNNYIDRINHIYIYFDYKYCIVNISKEFYKRVCNEGLKCIDDLDLSKSVKESLLNICISFDNRDEFIRKNWVNGVVIDYLFLNIGVDYLRCLKNGNSLENDLKVLIVDDYDILISYSEYIDLINIILKYKDNCYFKDWYRTYMDYVNYNKLSMSIAEKSN